jgi:membrane protease YdiL (CAAX protease family)
VPQNAPKDLASSTVSGGILRKLACLGIFAGWFVVQIVADLVLGGSPLRPWQVLVTQAAGIVWVGAWYVYMRKRDCKQAREGKPVVAVAPRPLGARNAWFLAGAVVLVYLLAWLYAWGANVPSEVFMQTLFEHRSAPQIGLQLAALLVFAPVGEQLAFSYFLLEALPYRRGGWYAVGAVALVAIAFGLVNVQYEYTSTTVLLMATAAIYVYARLLSGRILPSMLLHGLATTMALAVQYVRGFN